MQEPAALKRGQEETLSRAAPDKVAGRNESADGSVALLEGLGLIVRFQRAVDTGSLPLGERVAVLQSVPEVGDIWPQLLHLFF